MITFLISFNTGYAAHLKQLLKEYGIEARQNKSKKGKNGSLYS